MHQSNTEIVIKEQAKLTASQPTKPNKQQKA
jgi:hypothetical protein